MEPLQRGLDILSCILAKERQMRELQRLVAPLQMATDINGPEPWIALAYSLFAAGKYTKAAYFAQKVSIGNTLKNSLLHFCLLFFNIPNFCEVFQSLSLPSLL